MIKLGFKSWLEATAVYDNLGAKADAFFGRRDQNAKLDFKVVLKALGLPPGQGVVVNKGSTATIYKHPTDPSKLIKVTGDTQDANNLQKAQRVNSPNVVRVHQYAKVGPTAHALVVDQINGQPMVYPSNAFVILIEGGGLDDLVTASRKILNPSGSRLKVLRRFGKEGAEECQKLSQLFGTLAKLERLGISMFDFTDNVIDAGDRYVIIDLGQ